MLGDFLLPQHWVLSLSSPLYHLSLSVFVCLSVSLSLASKRTHGLNCSTLVLVVL